MDLLFESGTRQLIWMPVQVPHYPQLEPRLEPRLEPHSRYIAPGYYSPMGLCRARYARQQQRVRLKMMHGLTRLKFTAAEAACGSPADRDMGISLASRASSVSNTEQCLRVSLRESVKLE